VREFLAAEPALAHGAGVHGLPALYFAAVGGSVAVAELLRGAGADVNAGAGGNTPLHGAAITGQEEMAAWLLEQGADPSLGDYEHKTPLERAVAGGHRRVAELIRARL
jgi:ankyrin repeat protein